MGDCMSDARDNQPSWKRFENFTAVTRKDENEARFKIREDGRRSAGSSVGGGNLTWTPPRHFKHKPRLVGHD